MDDLETVERKLLQALQLGDLSASASLLRDDFLITTAGWLPEPVGKRTWLDALTGRMTLDDFDLRLIATRTYGDVAVLLVESRQKGTHDGAPFAMTFRYTDVWVLENAGWRLAIRHASGITSQRRPCGQRLGRLRDSVESVCPGPLPARGRCAAPGNRPRLVAAFAGEGHGNVAHAPLVRITRSGSTLASPCPRTTADRPAPSALGLD